MKPGSIQMIVLHGQMFAMLVGKGPKFQLTFSVVIIGAKRESYQVCKQSWHPKCYKDCMDMFPIHEPE